MPVQYGLAVPVSVLSLVLAACGLCAGENENLVRNPSFEDAHGREDFAAHWGGQPDLADFPAIRVRKSGGAPRTGEGFCRFQETEPHPKDWISASCVTAPIPVEQGAAYKAWVWIRIPNALRQTRRGAIFSVVGFMDEPDRKHTVQGIKFQTAPGWGWTEHEVGRVNKTDVYVNEGWERLEIGLKISNPLLAKIIVRLGMTGVGEVHFDDVDLRRVPPEEIAEPVRVGMVLLPPVLHDAIFQTLPVQEIRAQFDIAGIGRDRVRISATLTDPAQPEPLFDSDDLALNERDVASFPAPPFDAGSALTLAVKAVSRETRSVLYEATKTIRQLPTAPSEALIDASGTIIVNGKPFFPIGAMPGIEICEFERAAAMGINVTGFYKPPGAAYVKAAADAGLHVMFSQRRAGNLERLKPFHDDPAFFGYDFFDVPTPLTNPPEEVLATYRAIAAADPYHIIHGDSVSYFDLYRNAVDLYTIDEYPIPGDLDVYVTLLEELRRSKEGRGALGVIVQAFTYQGYGRGTIEDYPYPTFDELRAMTWLAICKGAKAVIFYGGFQQLMPGPDVGGIFYRYAYPVCWESYGHIARELSALSYIARAPEFAGPVSLVAADGRPAGGLHWSARRDGEDFHLVAVNAKRAEANASFTIAELGSATLNVVGENRSLTLVGGTFTDSFKPLDTHIYTTGEIGSALPRPVGAIRAELQAKEDAARAARTRNLACQTNAGTELIASWGSFPERGEVLMAPWHLVNDGSQGTFWRVGHDPRKSYGKWLAQKGTSVQGMAQGERWVGVKFAKRAPVRKVVLVSAGIEPRVELVLGGEAVPLAQVSRKPVTVHPIIEAEMTVFSHDGSQAGAVRVRLPEKKLSEETIFEIEAYRDGLTSHKTF